MKLKDFVEKPGLCTRIHIITHVEKPPTMNLFKDLKIVYSNPSHYDFLFKTGYKSKY